MASDDAVRVLEVNRALHLNKQQIEVASGDPVRRQRVKERSVSSSSTLLLKQTIDNGV